MARKRFPNKGYKDSLALQRQRFFQLKIVGAVIIALAIITGAIYFLFFSSVLRITAITINTDSNINQEDITLTANTFLDAKTWFLKVRRNIFLVNSDNLEADLRTQFPLIRDVSVKKKYPHTLNISLKEHVPLGIWCYSGHQCQYFDKNMAVWGNPGQSSGFILLNVNDKRSNKDKVIDEHFFKPILDAVKDLPKPLIAKEVIIPEQSLSDFKVVTDSGYYLLFSYESNLANQLKALKLFLDSKADDLAFQPQYIDLRIDGRVYYK